MQAAYLLVLFFCMLPIVGLLAIMLLWWLGKVDRPFLPGYCKRCGERIVSKSDDHCAKCGHAINRCENCGYSLVGNTTGVCPECGLKPVGR
jgi:hypothetical protein